MKANKLSIILVLCGFIFGLSATCQVPKTFNEDAKVYFDKVLTQLGVPGFAVTVTYEGETVLADGYGFADVEGNVRADSQTNYYIASATKSFTGLLAAILDEEGIIKLDDPLSKYFPGVKPESGIDFSKILIQDLLTHSSGISNDGIGWRTAFSGDHDLQTLMELIPLCVRNDAGYGNYEYTNVGYNIYTIILEQSTGKSWQDWMQEKIFDPTGMARTSAYISRATDGNWPLARPYLVLDSTERLSLEKKDNTMQSAGGLIITAEDMATWLILQTDEGSVNGQQIISKEVMAKTHARLVETPDADRTFNPTHYGLGWLHSEMLEREVIHHFGGFAGFATHVSFMPQERIGVSVMVNEALAGNRLMNVLADYVYDYLINQKEPDYTADLDAFSQGLAGARSSISAGVEERKAREWMLSGPFESCSGSYKSEEYGTFEITASENGLIVTNGNLSCSSTPYTEQDSIRVELIPTSGEVIQFIHDDGVLTGLRYDGIDFKKAE